MQYLGYAFVSLQGLRKICNEVDTVPHLLNRKDGWVLALQFVKVLLVLQKTRFEFSLAVPKGSLHYLPPMRKALPADTEYGLHVARPEKHACV